MKNIAAVRSDVALLLLDNIIRVMSDKTISKREAADIVGGEKKLLRLIENGEIEAIKPKNVQNGKWYCNAAQVLLHCKYKKVKPKK